MMSLKLTIKVIAFFLGHPVYGVQHDKHKEELHIGKARVIAFYGKAGWLYMYTYMVHTCNSQDPFDYQVTQVDLVNYAMHNICPRRKCRSVEWR